jgi:hypothetical protein
MNRLPVELLSIIVNYIDLEDFKKLRLLNSFYNKNINNIVEKNKFIINELNIRLGLDKTQFVKNQKFIDRFMIYHKSNIYLPLQLVLDDYILYFDNTINYYLYTDTIIYRLVANSDDVLNYYNYDNICCKQEINLPYIEGYTYVCNKCLNIQKGEEGFIKMQNNLMFCKSCNLIRCHVSMSDYNKPPKERHYCCRICNPCRTNQIYDY